MLGEVGSFNVRPGLAVKDAPHGRLVYRVPLGDGALRISVVVIAPDLPNHVGVNLGEPVRFAGQPLAKHTVTIASGSASMLLTVVGVFFPSAPSEVSGGVVELVTVQVSDFMLRGRLGRQERLRDNLVKQAVRAGSVVSKVHLAVTT